MTVLGRAIRVAKFDVDTLDDVDDVGPTRAIHIRVRVRAGRALHSRYRAEGNIDHRHDIQDADFLTGATAGFSMAGAIADSR